MFLLLANSLIFASNRKVIILIVKLHEEHKDISSSPLVVVFLPTEYENIKELLKENQKEVDTVNDRLSPRCLFVKIISKGEAYSGGGLIRE